MCQLSDRDMLVINLAKMVTNNVVETYCMCICAFKVVLHKY